MKLKFCDVLQVNSDLLMLLACARIRQVSKRLTASHMITDGAAVYLCFLPRWEEK